MLNIILNIKTLLVILVIFIVLSCFNSFDKKTSYDDALNENWNISIIEKGECELICDEEHVIWNGDGDRYHFYSYENENNIFDSLNIKSSEDVKYCDDSIKEKCEDILNLLDIESSRRPNYKKCLIWTDSQKDNSQIYILIDQDNKYLYIIETFY